MSGDELSLFAPSDLIGPAPRTLFANRYAIVNVTAAFALDMVVRVHYLHRRCQCSHAFGLLDTQTAQIAGVVIYGTPMSAPLRAGICGPAYAGDVIELSRLWVADDVPRNGESYLIGNTIPRVTKPIIVSFAEIAQRHIGTIYQATNWIYTGLSAKRTDWTVDGIGVHGHTLSDAYTAREIREKYGDKFHLVPRGRKHRYVFFNANRREKRVLMKALRYPILPYPKQDDSPVRSVP